MKYYNLLFIFLMLFVSKVFSQNYYSAAELDQPPVFGNSNTEFLQNILASCKFISNTNCQSGNYEIQFDVIISKQEVGNILDPALPVKVEQVIFRSDLCEEFKSQIKISIFKLNNENKWSSGYFIKKKKLKHNIPYSKIEFKGNSVYSVPCLLPLLLSIEVKENHKKTDKSQINELNSNTSDYEAREKTIEYEETNQKTISQKEENETNLIQSTSKNNQSDKKHSKKAKQKIINTGMNQNQQFMKDSSYNQGAYESEGLNSKETLFSLLPVVLIAVIMFWIIYWVRKNKKESRIVAETNNKAIEEARIKEQIKAEEQARIKAEQDAKLKAEKEARIKTEKEEAKRKAEEQARIKAEQDAKLKAEEEARIKAEKEEAKRKAEEQARIKGERDAKLKAEEQARIKAEKEEEKRKAEEQARIKAEKEAKRKAAEDAQIKAQKEEVKRKAEEEARIEIENNSYYHVIIENGNEVIKGPFNFKQMEKLLQKNEISLLTKVKFGLNKKTLKPLKEFKEFTTGLEDFL
jgi:hypothetical protein